MSWARNVFLRWIRDCGVLLALALSTLVIVSVVQVAASAETRSTGKASSHAATTSVGVVRAARGVSEVTVDEHFGSDVLWVQPKLSRASVVGAETVAEEAPRCIGSSAGDLLDTSRITIPEGKFGYLLENRAKRVCSVTRWDSTRRPWVPRWRTS